MTELYKKHRPTDFDSVVGQPSLKILKSMLKKNELPHSILLTGSSGCGKTTVARILRTKLDCGKEDFHEVNCADFRGIDMVRDIRSRMNLAPMNGSTRCWLIDEAHQLSSQAQNAFLKILEDTPKHVYFFLATTDPNKLLKTIRTRCSSFKMETLKPKSAVALLETVMEKEQIEIDDEVIDAVVNLGDGSPRQLLVLLDSIKHLDDEEEQLQLIYKSETKKEAIEIARTLMKPKPIWSEVASVLKTVQEEPESIRWMMLSYANSVLLKGGRKARHAYIIIDAFRDNFYDSKKAGLTAACFEVVQEINN